jgi:hypothetical protein
MAWTRKRVARHRLRRKGAPWRSGQHASDRVGTRGTGLAHGAGRPLEARAGESAVDVPAKLATRLGVSTLTPGP